MTNKLKLIILAAVLSGSVLSSQESDADNGGTSIATLSQTRGSLSDTGAIASDDVVIIDESIIEGDAVEVKGSRILSIFDEPVYKDSLTWLPDAPMQKRISVLEAMAIPGVMGDPIKAVQTLPGVSSGFGGFFVHGSKSYETAYTINQLPVGYLFHMGALHSVMSPEAIEQIDAYLGGFDCSMGNAIGGILDVTPRTPEGSNSGYVHLGLLDSSLGYDGRITDKLSWSIHGRRSYFDLILPVEWFADDDEDKDGNATRITVFPNYYDVNAMLAYRNGKHTVSLETLIADDEFGAEVHEDTIKDPAATGAIKMDFGFQSAGLRWRYDDDSYRANTFIGYLHTYQKMYLFEDFSFDLIDHKTTVHHTSSYRVGNHEISAGAEVQFEQMPVDMTFPQVDEIDPDITTAPSVTVKDTVRLENYAVFAQDAYTFRKDFTVRFGVRAEYPDFGDYQPIAMPRGSAVYRLSENDVLSASAGIYANRPEAYTLFKDFGNPRLGYEKANHYGLAWFRDFGDNGTLSVEPYYKTLYHLAIEDSDNEYEDSGNGEVFGVDVSYKIRKDNWNLSLSYAFQHAKRQVYSDDDEQYNFYGDIPHTAQLGMNYQLPSGWSFGFLAKYSTGSAYTPITGTYLHTDIDGSTRIRPIYGDPYSKRMPYFFMLNLRFAYTQLIGVSGELEYSFEVLNATARNNIQGYQYDDEYNKESDATGLPIIPTFNLTYRF